MNLRIFSTETILFLSTCGLKLFRGECINHLNWLFVLWWFMKIFDDNNTARLTKFKRKVSYGLGVAHNKVIVLETVNNTLNRVISYGTICSDIIFCRCCFFNRSITVCFFLCRYELSHLVFFSLFFLKF